MGKPRQKQMLRLLMGRASNKSGTILAGSHSQCGSHSALEPSPLQRPGTAIPEHLYAAGQGDTGA